MDKKVWVGLLILATVMACVPFVAAKEIHITTLKDGLTPAPSPAPGHEIKAVYYPNIYPSNPNWIYGPTKGYFCHNFMVFEVGRDANVVLNITSNESNLILFNVSGCIDKQNDILGSGGPDTPIVYQFPLAGGTARTFSLLVNTTGPRDFYANLAAYALEDPYTYNSSVTVHGRWDPKDNPIFFGK